MADPYRELRTRLAQVEADLAARGIQFSDSASMLAGIVERSTTGTLTLPCFVDVRSIDGAGATPVERGTSAPVAGTAPLVPVAFFDRIPEDGDFVIASYRMPQGRWIARRGIAAPGGPGVIDPPCANGITNPDATFSYHLKFFTPSTLPPYPEMDVTLHGDHFLEAFGGPQYRWTTDVIPFPTGSTGEGKHFLIGIGCGTLRPTASRLNCLGMPNPQPEDCLLIVGEDGTEFNDMTDGPVVIYGEVGFVMMGFHGHD